MANIMNKIYYELDSVHNLKKNKKFSKISSNNFSLLMEPKELCVL